MQKGILLYTVLMTDTSHTQILICQPSWKEKFLLEKEILQKIFGEEAISIEHIGSTSVEGLSAKPIIDIAVLIGKRKDSDKFIEPLSRLGYWYDQPNSSGERHLFRKGQPTEFHLSIAYTDKGDFWERQIIFRDYLRNNPKTRNEYARLKENLLKNDPTGGNGYVGGKSEFIQNVLRLAREKLS